MAQKTITQGRKSQRKQKQIYHCQEEAVTYPGKQIHQEPPRLRPTKEEKGSQEVFNNAIKKTTMTRTITTTKHILEHSLGKFFGPLHLSFFALVEYIKHHLRKSVCP